MINNWSYLLVTQSHLREGKGKQTKNIHAQMVMNILTVYHGYRIFHLRQDMQGSLQLIF